MPQFFTSRPVGALVPRAACVAAAESSPRHLWFALVLGAVVLALGLAMPLRRHLCGKCEVCGLALLTMVRYCAADCAQTVWVPIDLIGLRRATSSSPSRSFCGIPGDLLFPLAVYGIAAWRLNANVAESADDPHTVVHPVQRHRRRLGHAERLRTSHETCTWAAGCGGARSRCRACCRTT
jgi:hypothetical protein